MANITTCTRCGALYQAESEEAANAPERLCLGCDRGKVLPVARRPAITPWETVILGALLLWLLTLF